MSNAKKAGMPERVMYQRIFIKGADAHDLPFDRPGKYEYLYTTKEMDKFTVPYVPEAELERVKAEAREEAFEEAAESLEQGAVAARNIGMSDYADAYRIGKKRMLEKAKEARASGASKGGE